MLVVGGKNPLGHVVHMIVGPETEFQTDIHGATVVDVTPLLMAMNGAERIFLSYTRCRSEFQTAQIMNSSEVPHLNSFVTSQNNAENKGANVPAAAPTGEQVKKTTRCSYCNSTSASLLPIPGFKICTECAQIELGRKRQAAEKEIKKDAQGA